MPADNVTVQFFLHLFIQKARAMKQYTEYFTADTHFVFYQCCQVATWPEATGREA